MVIERSGGCLSFSGLWVVSGDTFADGIWRDIECGGDSGSTSHIRNCGLTGEEASDSEGFVAKSEAGFSSLTIEFGIINAQVGIGRGSIGQSFGLAAEIGKIWVA